MRRDLKPQDSISAALDIHSQRSEHAPLSITSTQDHQAPNVECRDVTPAPTVRPSPWSPGDLSWIPAFAGMTTHAAPRRGFPVIPAKAGIQFFSGTLGGPDSSG